MAYAVLPVSRSALARLGIGKLPLGYHHSLQRSLSLDIAVGTTITVAAFAFSISHPWTHAYAGDVQFGDAAYWDLNGESWARGYLATKVPDIRPGYSVFLGVIYSLFGPDFRYGFVGQALLFALGGLLVFLLGKWVAGRLVGAIAAALFTLNPYMWEWTATSTTDLVGSIANLTSIFFLVRALRQKNAWISVALFGFFFGIANVVRVFTLSFIAPAILILLLSPRPTKRRFELSAVAVVGAGAALMLGAIYQYRSTGDLGLSSNSSSAVFAASSPKYGTWSPAIYDDVAAQLDARGVTPTPQNMDTEFSRLAVQNYLNYPLFQVERVIQGMQVYVQFEGEDARPDRYFFFRPHLIAAFAALTGVLVLVRFGWRRSWLALPSAALIAAVEWAPLSSLVALQLLAGVSALVLVVRRPRARQLGAAAIALYWTTTGVFAVFSAGISGALLFRLYTQVEPAHALLLALGSAQCVFMLERTRDRRAVGRWATLAGVARTMPRFSGLLRPLAAVVAALFTAMVLFGTAKMVAANLVPAPTAESFPTPSPDQLRLLAEALHLQTPVVYADATSFEQVRAALTARELPATWMAYAVPGQFTRFIWDLNDEERTMFWFAFSDRTRPDSLDRRLLYGEAAAQLQQASLRDRDGMLVFVPTAAYNDTPGAIALINVTATRAFVPWDQGSRQFRFDDAMVFPLATPLFDHKRVAAASIQGTVGEVGPLRVSAGGRVLEDLALETAASSGSPLQASITYHNLPISTGTYFRAWVSLRPEFFGNPTVGPEEIQLRASSGPIDEVVARMVLDPARSDQWGYVPWNVDLSEFQGQDMNLTLQIQPVNSSADRAISVLVGEPRLITP